MNKPVFRVVGLDHATCDDEYCGPETTTQSSSAAILGAELSLADCSYPPTVIVRLRDVISAFQHTAAARLAWVNDFADDPIVITKDLYDVLLTYERLRNAA